MFQFHLAASQDDWSQPLAFVAAIVALAAFIVAYRDSRRNTRPMVRIVSVDSLYRRDAKGGEWLLEFVLRNCGIPLNDVSLCLGFCGPKLSGYITVPIPVWNRSSNAATSFVRGSIAKFVLSSRDKSCRGLPQLIEDIRLQEVSLNLYSSAFRVCSFPLWRRWDNAKIKWKNLALRLSFQKRVGEGVDGKGVHKLYHLPFWPILSERLQYFLNGLREDGKEEDHQKADSEKAPVVCEQKVPPPPAS